MSTKIVPMTSRLLVDPEKTVRTQAFKNINLFIKKLEKIAESMPETTKSPTAIGSKTSNQPQPGGAGWADWALSTVSSKLAGMNIEPTRTESVSSAPEAFSGSEKASPPTQPSGNLTTPGDLFASNTSQILKPSPAGPKPLSLGANKMNSTRNYNFDSSGFNSAPAPASYPVTANFNTATTGWDNDGWGNDLIDLDESINTWTKNPVAAPIKMSKKPAPVQNDWGADDGWGDWSSPQK